MSSLKSYIVTFKDTASDADVSALQQKIHELGGDVTSKFSLIKGFAAKFPEVHTNTIQGNEHVLAIEEDKEVKIQQ
ncbi:protease propeptide/inhibitor [Suhomyces tanzawaensis NRRL Y-17324]|uniref:Protease propeptide/inhibitor n=1 Tax=Suhomyces tanzawaensis NRRL Y-17324 TaxID=984487 RepID=A0A1E4SM68_9ASCO|nr:protease propeptide/inhibitor [Suhomyces tanzawaensis NRRL Y-17324]ODV80624.1 protease propeptide/inhibitor [Suhomyces tanzawaensis NRRL Y-17324]